MPPPVAAARNASHAPAKPPGIAALASWLALVVVYLALEWLSLLLEHAVLPITPWNPGLGLMFAILILRGSAYGILLFASVVLAELLVLHSDLGWPLIIAVAAVVSAAYASVAVVARDRLEANASTPHVHTRDIATVITSGLAGAVISSALLALLMRVAGHLDGGELIRTAGLLALGDAIGIAVMTPLVLRAVRRHQFGGTVPARALVELGVAAAVIILALGIIMQPEQPHRQSLLYLLFLPVVVAAIRHGIDGACATLAIAQISMVAFLHVYGFDLARFTEYQLLMLVMTVTVLLVGAVVSERDAADQAARDAAERLQQLEHEAAGTARLNLVSGMAAALAHEINQPLTAARALARSVGQLVASENADLSRAQRNVTAMVEQIDHAAGVVRRVREFLRRGEPGIAPVDPARLVEEALALAQPQASAERVALRFTPPDGLPQVLADRIQIQQVVLNLVRNAIDAIADTGRADGRIEVGITTDPAACELEIGVRDNGTGIAPDHLDTIFVPLSTTRAHGLGLGLPICQAIIQAHGGRIWVGDTSPAGTDIRFTLPMAREASDGA
jgi:signal transduction histidine kinase